MERSIPWWLRAILWLAAAQSVLTLAILSLLAIRELTWQGIRWLVFMLMLLALLVLVVSLLHLSRFTNGLATIIWFGVEALVFGSLFIRHLVRPSPKEAFLLFSLSPRLIRS